MVEFINFVSLNVRGICNTLKRKKIFLWLKRQKCDIALLQETFLSRELENVISNEWRGLGIYDHGTRHSRGVAILIRKDLPITIINIHVKGDGRAIAIRFTSHDFNYFCLNVYAPAKNTKKESFYSSLCSWVKKLKKQNDIMLAGGDWNCVQNKKLDTNGMSYIYSPKKSFVKFQHCNNLVDVWRKFFPERKQFTWRQLSLNIHSRLDYWLVSKANVPFIYSLDIKPVLRCDHNAVTMKLQVTTKKRGKGFWKLNNSLLKDETYKQGVRNIIKNIKIEYNSFDYQFMWEMCKIKIREYSMKYASDVSKRRKKHISSIEKEYNQLCMKLDKDQCPENIEKISRLKREIDKWYEYQCKGAYIRSRARWLEFGEKSSKYFFQLEKTKGKKKEIDCVDINGKTVTDDVKILNEIYDFYRKLYKKDDVNLDFKDYISNLEFNVLSEEDANLCEGKLTENECWIALKSMNLNKSPGSDGLSVEFYKCFWDDLKQMVVDSLNQGYDKKELSSTQSQAILTLLYKKGNKNLLDNWRPISLLNIDYKLVARVLTLR